MLSSSLATFRRFLENFGLTKPSVKLRRHFADECQTPGIKTVEKVAIATITFIEGPGLNCNAITLRSVDQVQGYFRLGLELNAVGDVTFFRRAASSAHSSGRYRRASSKQWKFFAV